MVPKNYTLDDVMGNGGVEIISAAVTEAEKRTSGEVLVRVVQRIEPPDAPSREAAMQEFRRFGVDATRERNGVLIFVALDQSAVELLADEGVARVIPQEFWQQVVNIVTLGFRTGVPAASLAMAVTLIGDVLSVRFPPLDVGDSV